MKKRTDGKSVFVYGTLMEGFGNWSWALQNRSVKKTNGKIKGFKMLSLGPFPMIVEEPNKEVKGELFSLSEGQEPTIWGDLDRLEGEGSFYHRIPCRVEGEDGNTYDSEVYVGRTARGGAAEVDGGDWRAYRARGISKESI